MRNLCVGGVVKWRMDIINISYSDGQQCSHWIERYNYLDEEEEEKDR